MTKKGEACAIVPTEIAGAFCPTTALTWSTPPVRESSALPATTCCSAIDEPRACSIVTLRPSRSKKPPASACSTSAKARMKLNGAT